MNTEVTLNTGKTIPDVLVRTTMIALREVMESNPIALYELVQTARNRDHVLFGSSGQQLQEIGLLDWMNPDGTAHMHDAVRDVIKAAVQGEELDLNIVSPLAS